MDATEQEAEHPTARRDYLAWFIGDTGVALGGGLRGLAVTLLAYGVTGSTEAAGLLGTATTLVQLVLTPVGGVIVDRHDRRATMRLCALVGLTVWLGVGVLAATGLITFGWLMALALVGAVNGGGCSPTPPTPRCVRWWFSATTRRPSRPTRGETG